MRGCVLSVAICFFVASARGAVVGVVAQTGDTISGHTLTNLLNRPYINNAGHVVYAADYSGGEGIFADHGAVVLAGDNLGGDIFSFVYGGQPVINNAGTIAFTYRDPGSVTHIATTNGFVSTFGPVDGFNLLSIGYIAQNDSGSIVYSSNISNGGIQDVIANTSHILLQTPATIGGFSFNQIDPPSYMNLNNAGTFTFQAVNSSTSATCIVTQSAAIAGVGSIIAGKTLTSVDEYPAINNAGTVAFHGFFNGFSSNAIFAGNKLVMQTGTVVDGRTIQSFGTLSLGIVDINNPGQIAYLANYSGGGAGIFVDSLPAVQTGDVVNGKTITALDDPVLNDSGIVTFWAQFNDGSQAILTATVPEPASLAAAIAVLEIARRRRR